MKDGQKTRQESIDIGTYHIWRESIKRKGRWELVRIWLDMCDIVQKEIQLVNIPFQYVWEERRKRKILKLKWVVRKRCRKKNCVVELSKGSILEEIMCIVTRKESIVQNSTIQWELFTTQRWDNHWANVSAVSIIMDMLMALKENQSKSWTGWCLLRHAEMHGTGPLGLSHPQTTTGN